MVIKIILQWNFTPLCVLVTLLTIKLGIDEREGFEKDWLLKKTSDSKLLHYHEVNPLSQKIQSWFPSRTTQNHNSNNLPLCNWLKPSIHLSSFDFKGKWLNQIKRRTPLISISMILWCEINNLHNDLSIKEGWIYIHQ